MVLQPPQLAEVIELRIAGWVEDGMRGPLEAAVGKVEEPVSPVLRLVPRDAVQAHRGVTVQASATVNPATETFG